MPWYNGYAGYSRRYSTRDGQHHAVDWYWQCPTMALGGLYHWEILEDCADPTRWYEACCHYSMGHALMEDPARMPTRL